MLCFSTEAQVLLGLGFIALLVSAFLYARSKDRAALLCLLGGALALRLFAAVLDPYLNTWDECFHALVAKNTATDPFKPMLFREEALHLDYRNWTQNNVWLHKQPFFLWCMALSIKLLGPTVLAVRLPSALFTTALVFFTYGIARKMHDRHVAFLSAFFMACSQWVLTLVMGQAMTDHNDAIFISLIGGSLWAWYALREDGPRLGDLLCGVFVGLAVLTKWLPGLLVFGGWGVVALFAVPDRKQELLAMGRSLLVALVIALPWQIYGAIRFPAEMAHTRGFDAKHVSEALDGHTGGPLFHYDALAELIRPFPSWMLVVLALAGAIGATSTRYRVHALASLIFTYFFYSTVATKMTAYPMITLPFFMIGIAFASRLLARPLSDKRVPLVTITAAIAIGWGLLQYDRTVITHSDNCIGDPFYADHRAKHKHNRASIDLLSVELSSVRKPIVFNVPFPVNIYTSFFTPFEAQPGLPTSEQRSALERKGYTVVVVDPPSTTQFPPSIHLVHLGRASFVNEPL
ncbi:MAG: glycosyltransferase family 39 protein [Bacteroidetes bacterium]|nr:glycosyltransferase family 39 protein [Bacteroidota bacterium]